MKRLLAVSLLAALPASAQVNNAMDLTTPPPNSTIHASQTAVSGILPVNASANAVVIVAGQAGTLFGGRFFTRQGVQLQPGENTIAVQYMDQAQSLYLTAAITVTSEPQAIACGNGPQVAVAPSGQLFTSPAAFTGTVADPDGVGWVRINGFDATLASANATETEFVIGGVVGLLPGPNQVLVEAGDENGDISQTVLTVNFNAPDPADPFFAPAEPCTSCETSYVPTSQTLTCLNLGLPSGCASLPADNPWGVGVNEITDPGSGDASDMNARWVRWDLYWYKIDRCGAGYDWREADGEMADMVAKHVRILAQISGVPTCLAGGPNHNNPPTDPAAYYRFVQEAVTRYKNFVHHWSLWNEPNLTEFWSAGLTRYTEVILVPGSNAVRASDPSAKVVGFELSWHGMKPLPFSLPSYLDTLMNRYRGNIDVLSQHVYDDCGGSPKSLGCLDSWLVPVLRRYGWYGTHDFWLTEWGYKSDNSVCPMKRQSVAYDRMMGGRDSRAAWFTKAFLGSMWEPVDFSGALTHGSTIPRFRRYAFTTFQRHAQGLPYLDPASTCAPIVAEPLGF